jgi:hypothetical protein
MVQLIGDDVPAADYHIGQGIWKICMFNGIEKDARRSKSAEL